MVKTINKEDTEQPAIERKKQSRKDLQEPEECEIVEKKTRKPKTQKQLDALKLGRERRKENLLNNARPKEVVEEPKTEHKVKSRGITKKPRKNKQSLLKVVRMKIVIAKMRLL